MVRATRPEELRFARYGEEARTLIRGGHGSAAKRRACRACRPRIRRAISRPFANLYRDAIALISARRRGELMDLSLAGLVPSVEDGLLGMRFIEASVDSNEAGGVWTPIATQL